MSKCSASRKDAHRYLMLWCLLLVFAWLIQPSVLLSQPADVPSVVIQRVRDVQLGDSVAVSINWTNDDSTFEVGGFDFLFAYGTSVLNFLSAEPGQLLVDCEWEYFQYRYGSNDSCGDSTCPSGIARVVAVADINNGSIHPTCYANSPGELASLQFFVADDQIFECQFVPIRWIWYDCGDNAFSSKVGDSLFVSRNVYDFEGTQIDSSLPFPTFSGAPDTCVGAEVVRVIDFYNGGVDFLCHDSVSVRGDINLNGICYEIADWVLFCNYFLYGLSVFHVSVEGQTKATDINADGITLTLDDLIYLWRIITGDSIPFPRVPTDTAVFTQDVTNRIVDIAYSDSLTAAYLVFRGNVVPTSLVGELGMSYNFDGVYTRILAFPPLEGGPPPIFTPGPLMTYEGNGLLEEAYVSDYGVNKIETSILINGYPGSHADISPDTISAYWGYVTDTTYATVYFGDFADRDVNDIDQLSISINDIVAPISIRVLPEWPGFTGPVMEITFSAGEFVQSYMPQYNTSARSYLVSGDFYDSSPFAVIGQVTISGTVLGDVDLNGELNIVDVIFLVDYLFTNGAVPPAMEAADIYADGFINIVDVTSLAKLLFE